MTGSVGESLLGTVLASITSVGLVVGCDGSNTSTAPQSTPTTVDRGCGSNSCRCDDGSLGKWDCSSSRCASCVACPPVSGEAPSTFDACGGEPFGTWTVTSADVSGIKYVGYTSDSSTAGRQSSYDCPARAVAQSDITGLKFRISLVSGGTGTVDSKGPIATIDISGDAARRLFYTCDDQRNCVSVSDCICECSESIRPLSTSFEWTRSGSNLNLDLGTLGTASYDYCVQGDTLRLLDSISGVAYVMQRLVENGAPLRCASRSSDTCTSGAGISGCYLGQCSGSGNCSAGSESSCTNQAGCSWNASACTGTAPTTCGFFDYDVVPGCVYLSTGENAACVGTPSACPQINLGTCRETPGCTIGTECVGRIPGFSYACGVQDESVLSGCSCDNYAVCTSYKCEDQTAANCRDSNCKLQDTTCQGTPLPCSQHSTSKCSSVPGCSLQKVSN
jgi:hypothetical protein